MTIENHLTTNQNRPDSDHPISDQPEIMGYETNRDQIERELFASFEHASEPEKSTIKERIFNRYKYLIKNIIPEFRDRTDPETTKDLYQEGSIGLLLAIDRFDLNKGVKFVTFASTYIRGTIQHYFRDKHYPNMIRLAGHAQEIINQIRQKAIEHKIKFKDIDLNNPDHLNILGLDENSANTAKAALEAQGATMSLDSPIFERDGQSEEDGSSYEIPQEDIDFAKTELRIAFEQILNQLEPDEARVINLLFYEGVSLSEASRLTNFNKEKINYIKRKTLRKLRELLIDQGINPQ